MRRLALATFLLFLACVTSRGDRPAPPALQGPAEAEAVHPEEGSTPRASAAPPEAPDAGRPPPHPVRFTVTAWPAGAAVEIVDSEGRSVRGTAPLATTLPSGPTVVRVSAKGRRPEEHAVTLEADAGALDVCLDPPDQLVDCERLIKTGTAPKSVLLDYDGGVAWVADLYGPASVQVFDTRTGELLAAPRAGKEGAVELEPSADGTRLYASQLTTGLILELDVATHALLRTFSCRGQMPKVLRRSADGGTLFTANWASDDVSEVRLETGTLVRKLKTVHTPRGLYASPDGRWLYVAGFGNGRLAKVDLETGQTTVLFTGGRALRHIVPDPEGKLLYVSDLGRSRVYRYHLDTGEMERWIDTDATPNTIALSPDGHVLFVSSRGTNSKESYLVAGDEWGSVQLFDTATGALLDAIVGGNQCTGLAVSGDGRVLAFSDFLDRTLRVYRVPDYQALLAGGGGRAKTYRADLAKKRPPPARPKLAEQRP